MWRATTFVAFLFWGAFFYVLLSAVAAGTTGLNVVSAIPIILSLLLGGCAPIMLTIRFRVGLRTGQVLCGLLIAYILVLVAADPSDWFALVAALPLLATIGIAQVAAGRTHDTAARLETWWYRLPGALAALTAAWLILEIAVRLVA